MSTFVENVNKLASNLPDDISGTITEFDSRITVLEERNEYTDTDKSKLDGIEANANNYSHPSSHPVSILDGSGNENKFIKSSSIGNVVFSAITQDDITGTIDASKILETTSKKFVTTAQNLLIETAEQTSMKGIANGYAPLNAFGTIDSGYLPAFELNTVYPNVPSEAAMLALGAKVADIAIRTDLSDTQYMCISLPSSVIGNWRALTSGGGIVQINGKSGTSVTLNSDEVPEGTSNLYYTNTRVNNYINSLTAADLSAII